MDARRLFEANLGVIERAITRVCRDARLDRASEEDFSSFVRLALLADDCAILRKFEERSSLATYLTIVVRRLLVDVRRAEGRWYSSAEALGVGGGLPASPSLRTGLADRPHPALQGWIRWQMRTRGTCVTVKEV